MLMFASRVGEKSSSLCCEVKTLLPEKNQQHELRMHVRNGLKLNVWAQEKKGGFRLESTFQMDFLSALPVSQKS